MQSLSVDKLTVVQKLVARGFSRDQAEGVAEILDELDASLLTTKSDLKDLEVRLYKHMSGILIAHGIGTAALTVALLQLLG